MATEQASKQPHFLLIPYSEQGHLTPMLSLAFQLLRLGCLVTFVKADRHLPAPANSDGTSASAQTEPPTPKPQHPTSAPSCAVDGAAAHERLRFVTLPVRNKALCVDLKTMVRFQIFKNTLAGLEDRRDLIAEIIEELKPSSYPITCIICDLFLWKWVRHIARTHRLPSAVFCLMSALSFYRLYFEAIGKDEEIEELFVSQLDMPSTKANTAYVGFLNMKDSLELKLQKRNFFSSLFEGIEEANTILINTFKVLEAPLLQPLWDAGFHVRFIGPCLPKLHISDVGMGNIMLQQAGCTFLEDTTCLMWLDQQEKGSVLYVSFGSEAELAEKQVEEIELGIGKSGYKFLWVLRPNAFSSSRTRHGLCEKRNGKGKGMFVSWAPQERVLQHIVVGGFLTHSGWNSTLESLTFGVPMLCLPGSVDQPYTANFVQNYLQVGIRLSVDKDGLVHREVVASGVQDIMQGRFSQKVAQVQLLAQLAIEEAHVDLLSFVQAVA